MSFFQVNIQCNGCLACIQNCPAGALQYIDKDNQRILQHNITRCARCGHCWRICPQDAIEFQHLLQSDWDTFANLELVHCRECNEPIYSLPFSEKVNQTLVEKIEPLCPNHKKSYAVSRWKHLIDNNPRQEPNKP